MKKAVALAGLVSAGLLFVLGAGVARSGDAGGPGVGAPPRLPEDPVAGKLSGKQWREHLQFEERERQLGYDRRKLKEHRTLLKVLASARRRYDAARSEAALQKAQAQLPALVEEVGRRIAIIDHWGVNSRLLGDYQALLASLGDSYPVAVKAALNGERRPLKEVRAEMDQRLKAMERWLKEAAASEDE